MAKKIRILSIDGGGIRGIIPAVWLKKIEKETGHKISELFDYIAGTSIGGILSLLLTVIDIDGNMRHKAGEIYNIFESYGKQIFPSFSYQAISGLNGLLDEKYPSSGIETMLCECLGNATKFKTCKTKVIIPAYDVEKATPVIFKNWHDYYKELNICDIGRATSAAPTYFEPHKIPQWPNSTLVDGGLFANNPTICAYAEARKEHPEDDIMVVSLGTGILRRNLPYHECKDYGLASWAKVLLNVMMNGNSQTIDYQMKQILKHNESYFRLQVPLHIGNDDMDDASYTNMHALEFLADTYAKENNDLFDNFCKRLME